LGTGFLSLISPFPPSVPFPSLQTRVSDGKMKFPLSNRHTLVGCVSRLLLSHRTRAEVNGHRRSPPSSFSSVCWPPWFLYCSILTNPSFVWWSPFLFPVSAFRKEGQDLCGLIFRHAKKKLRSFSLSYTILFPYFPRCVFLAFWKVETDADLPDWKVSVTPHSPNLWSGQRKCRISEPWLSAMTCP